MRGITLDLRDRCKRPRCDKLIRKGKMAQANWQRYKPYCSYGCQEWHRLEQAAEYLERLRADEPHISGRSS